MVDIKEKQDNLESRVNYHTGYFYVINMCDFNLSNVYVRHTQKGVDTTVLTVPNISPLLPYDNEPKYFQYATGFGSPYDYWYIEFSTSFGQFATKNNFYCSLTSSDTGGVSIIILPSMSARMEFSSSSGCKVSLKLL